MYSSIPSSHFSSLLANCLFGRKRLPRKRGINERLNCTTRHSYKTDTLFSTGRTKLIPIAVCTWYSSNINTLEKTTFRTCTRTLETTNYTQKTLWEECSEHKFDSVMCSAMIKLPIQEWRRLLDKKACQIVFVVVVFSSSFLNPLWIAWQFQRILTFTELWVTMLLRRR